MTEQDFDFHEINIHKLEEEWHLQPKMFRLYADRVAEARYKHETAKTDKEIAEAELERVTAKLDRLVRSSPEDYGLSGKTTEASIHNVIILQKKYHIAQLAVFEAQRKINEAKHELDIADVAVKTLDHRKAALEDLVRLRLASYYSEPRAPEGNRELRTGGFPTNKRADSGK